MGWVNQYASALSLILHDAVSSQIAPENMVKTLYIFTDMQFNGGVARHGEWESTFEWARSAFEGAGYKLPNIVCWNLRTSSSKTMPVTKNEQGYAMLSGYSAELLKCILDAKEFTPMAIMKHVLEPYCVPESVLNCEWITNLRDSLHLNLDHLTEGVKKSEIKKAFKKSKDDDTSSNDSSDSMA